MGRMLHCHNCGQPLIEIDNRGEPLRGCLTCNLWAAGDAKSCGRGSRKKICARYTTCDMADINRAPAGADAPGVH